MRRFRVHIPMLGLFLAFSPAFLTANGQLPSDSHTKIKLLANVTSIKPGDSFMIGLLMSMDPGWHTYWKNAGEAGLPPEIAWGLPPGIEAGEILWPVPHKYVEGGEIITFGYEHENMLLIPMTTSPDLSAGSVEIIANVEWLECEKVCIPGSAAARLELPVRTTEPLPDNEALFTKYMARIPSRYAEDSDVSLSVKPTNGALELSIEPRGGRKLVRIVEKTPDLYPEAFAELELARTTVRGTEDRVILRAPVTPHEPGNYPPVFRGLLVYMLSGGSEHAVVVEVPLEPDIIEGLQKSAGGILDRDFAVGDSGGWDQPLAVYLVFAVIGGLLLNIMPCVLPVIGLKVFGLVKMGGEDPRKVRKLGWFFSLGILSSFLVLALLVIGLKIAGEQVGWGFQFQEPVFVIAMSAVVMAFGLSLFGVFEIQLPSAATMSVGDVVAKAGASGSGSLGSFSEGVFATILATPCTAPILGTALGFAFAQPAGIILLVFTAVAAGMALPYLILTLRPAWMKALPKPGEWMVTAKQFMGFLMMATLVWLLYILGKQLGMEAVIWTVAFLLTVAVACWLIGRFATLTATRTKFIATYFSAALIVMTGWFWFMQPVIEAKEIVGGSVGSTSAVDPEGIPWEPFSLESLEAHLNAGSPVFIDFTAEWCLTCKVNEKTVLADDDVIDRIREQGIVSIKADWTNRNADITKLLAKFGRSGVPLYVLFPAGRPSEPIVLPEVITSGIVLEAIEEARVAK